MIEKCPHCHRDVMFTRDICPACGHTSTEEERGKPTAFDEERDSSRVPTYFQPLEDELTVAQKRGLLLLMVSSVALLAPDVGIFVVRLRWLSFDIGALIRLALVVALLRILWRGRTWAKKATALIAAVAGIAGPLAALLWHNQLSAALVFLFCVWGVVLIFVAVTLVRSQDVEDYLKIRRKAAAKARNST